MVAPAMSSVPNTGQCRLFSSSWIFTLLLDSRNEALERLREAAREKGANAVVGMRFDCNEIASIMSEVAAYGTAVTLKRR